MLLSNFEKFVSRACNRAAALHGSRFASVCSASPAKTRSLETTDGPILYSRQATQSASQVLPPARQTVLYFRPQELVLLME